MSDNPFLWYWGDDEENMNLLHDQPMTFEEAKAEVLAAEEHEPGTVVHLVEATKATPGKFDAEDVFERWLDLNEECWGADWPDIGKDVTADLQNHLDLWMLANAHRLPPSWSFGTVRQTHAIPIPESDQGEPT